MHFSNGLYLAALVAHLPMLLDYCINTWKKGHYQFFPLLMIVVAWLIYDRLSTAGSRPAASSGKLVVAFLGIDLVILAASVLLFSPFLILPALMMLIGAYVTDRYGVSGLKKTLPVGLLLLFVVPLPADLDARLIQSMQFLASQLASWTLDAMGQIHFREGVVLVTEKKQFFTEEACSGIRSLFSSLAAITVYGVIRHNPLWRHVFNWAQTVVWVVIGNALRVAIVVYVSDNWTDAIASGTNHELLGLGIFVLIFALALSTDRALGVFSDKQQDFEIHDDNPIEITVVPSSDIPNKVSPILNWGFMLIFGFVFVFSARLNYALYSAQPTTFGDQDPTQRSDLPNAIDGWTCVDFQHEIRDEASLLAPESFIWTFRKDNDTAIISLDSPYFGFHDLTFCYEGLGWDTKTEFDYSSGIAQITMTKRDLYGMVYFAAFANDGSEVVPISASRISLDARTSDIWRNINIVLGGEHANIGIERGSPPPNMLPLSQIQLLRTGNSEVSDAEQLKLEQMLLKARDLLLKSARFSAK